MSITHYGSCCHLISSGGISFTAICTEKEALGIELALNIAATNSESQSTQADNKQNTPFFEPPLCTCAKCGELVGTKHNYCWYCGTKF